jgi:hypothetical protein
MKPFVVVVVIVASFLNTSVAGETKERAYDNRLHRIVNPQTLLTDYPQYIAPIKERERFEAALLVDDEQSDISLRAWRFSYHARGIIEVPNELRGDWTAIIVVHPWGIDDGQGWVSPEPAGTAFQCTPAKNKLVLEHAATVIEPMLERLRPQVKVVGYSLPGSGDPIRERLYRSVRGATTIERRSSGQKELEAKLRSFNYKAAGLPKSFLVSKETPTLAYFKEFPGLYAYPNFNPDGFWKLPIPIMKPIKPAIDDVVFYDAEGYEVLRDFLRKQGVRHIILLGYNTDMCVCSTTAGYKNLQQDFDVFLVGDATIATFPANPDPRLATNAAVSFASLNVFITQSSWIKPHPAKKVASRR